MKTRPTILGAALFGLFLLSSSGLASAGDAAGCSSQLPLPAGTKVLDVSPSGIRAVLPEGATLLSAQGTSISADQRTGITIKCQCSGQGNCFTQVIPQGNGVYQVDCAAQTCNANCGAGVTIHPANKQSFSALEFGLLATDRLVRLATVEDVRSLPMAKLAAIAVASEVRASLDEFAWKTLGTGLDFEAATFKAGDRGPQVLVRAFGYVVAVPAPVGGPAGVEAILLTQ